MHICYVHLAKVPEIMLSNELLTSNVHGLEKKMQIKLSILDCFNHEVL